jgi:Flp pilus assembly protein TadG
MAPPPDRSIRGQVVALFALSLTVVILVVGLVVDGGNVFLQRRDAQNAADLAAMAGTKRLADSYVKPGVPGDSVLSRIRTTMTANGCTAPAACTWTANYVGPRSGTTFTDLGPVADGAPPSGPLGVRVSVTERPRTYFLGVIGQTTWTVTTVATAIAGAIPGGPAAQVVPLAITDVPIQEGAVYAFTTGPGRPGNFGWIGWGGGQLANSICHPDNPAFGFPSEYRRDAGTSDVAGVATCLDGLVDASQPVLVPLVRSIDDPENNGACRTGVDDPDTPEDFTYCVIGLAAFVITGFAEPPIDQINGRFVGTISYSLASSVGGGVVSRPEEGDPLYAIGLAQ